MNLAKYISPMAIFIWIGFVCAISFMEAWLKFRAPGITIPLGLGIGNLVFAALNKVEWLLAIIIIIQIVLSGAKIFDKQFVFILIPISILILQTLWLLPALDARAQLYIKGVELPPSTLHIWFVVAEIAKVACLFLFGYKTLKILNTITI